MIKELLEFYTHVARLDVLSIHDCQLCLLEQNLLDMNIPPRPHDLLHHGDHHPSDGLWPNLESSRYDAEYRRTISKGSSPRVPREVSEICQSIILKGDNA